MSAKTLFLISLRIIGIFFLKDFVVALPQLLSAISLYMGYPANNTLSQLIGIVLTLALYGHFTYILLFRTDWFIDKLNLTSGLEEETLSIELKQTSALLYVAIVLVGGLLLLNAIPILVLQLFLLFQSQTKTTDAQIKVDTAQLIMLVVQIILGLVILATSKRIVAYIEWKRRKKD